MRWMKGSIDDRAVRLLWRIAVGLSLLVFVEVAIDLWASGASLADLDFRSGAGAALASTVSRAMNNLLAMMLAFIALAVPLTANLYTPKLIDIFLGDRVNLAVLTFFALMAAHAVVAQSLMIPGWDPVVLSSVNALAAAVGFVVLIPYYFYVLGFLDPALIIDRVTRRILTESAAFPTDPDGIRREQRRLDEDLLHLGNIALRAQSRMDRDVTIGAVNSLRRVVDTYSRGKHRAPDAWFDVPREIFIGLSDEALRLIDRDRIWVEQKALHQVLLTYTGALGGMRDAVSPVADAVRAVGVSAARRGDDALLRLSTRFFNTFLRIGMRRKELPPLADVLLQYRRLAIEILPHSPSTTAAIARHLAYYAGLARFEKVAFVPELAAYEVELVMEAAYTEDAPCAGEILDVLLGFERQGAGIRLFHTIARAAQFLETSTDRGAFDRVMAVLCAVDPDVRDAVRGSAIATDDPQFWEITDRQINLDYLDPERRAAFVALLDRIAAEPAR